MARVSQATCIIGKSIKLKGQADAMHVEARDIDPFQCGRVRTRARAHDAQYRAQVRAGDKYREHIHSRYVTLYTLRVVLQRNTPARQVGWDVENFSEFLDDDVKHVRARSKMNCFLPSLLAANAPRERGKTCTIRTSQKSLFAGAHTPR